MKTLGVLFLGLSFAFVAISPVQPQDAKDPKKTLPPGVADLVKQSPDEILKQNDKNKDGKLDRDEAPPFLSRAFDRADKNSDSKLDRGEIEGVLQLIRGMIGQAGKGPSEAELEKTIASLLQQFDTNKDAKISKDEARGKMADTFGFLDSNKDGFLDRQELKQMAARQAGGFGTKGPPFGGPGFGFGGPGLDFDAMDKDADGRLNAAEIKSSPFASKLAEIDTDSNGQIDRRELEAYQRKQANTKKE